jgi:hypothetical protein
MNSILAMLADGHDGFGLNPRQMRRYKYSMAMMIGVLALLYGAFVCVVGMNQRSFIYFPTHGQLDTPLRPWIEGNEVIGYTRLVDHPRTIWLMTHGNAGQASQRSYVLGRLARDASLFVLEYPGYGQRGGKPTMSSMNGAAEAAYRRLRREYPAVPVCVLGESIGSGPASHLCTLAPPPDKLVLVVPFDDLASVASDHLPLLPARLILRDAWNNADALRNYKGPVVIYGAVDDRIIPVSHARRLASSHPGSRFVEIEGGHNDWSSSESVQIDR